MICSNGQLRPQHQRATPTQQSAPHNQFGLTTCHTRAFTDLSASSTTTMQFHDYAALGVLCRHKKRAFNSRTSTQGTLRIQPIAPTSYPNEFLKRLVANHFGAGITIFVAMTEACRNQNNAQGPERKTFEVWGNQWQSETCFATM